MKKLETTVLKSTDSKRVGTKETLGIKTKGGNSGNKSPRKPKQPTIRELILSLMDRVGKIESTQQGLKDVIDYNVQVGILKSSK
jgi:hypothetical protein